ncbi:MAG: LacI family DNA-binding transcriptional regulator [Sphaerochaetaceae bacterium]|nr:LacI family DNA-binding transcriptional regulator [Sphaerochaetaceae bacterium]
MTQYLISMGHKKFAVFTGLTDYISTKERLTGCLAGFSKNNITDYKIYNMDWNPYKAYERAKVLFKEEKELPTAIICFNDNIAFGCIRAAREFGLQVPEDLSIVGFDNIDQSRYFSPTLTTVNSNIDQISQLAVQNILCQINNPNLSYIYKAIIPHTLKIRESSSAPPTQKVVIKKKY